MKEPEAIISSVALADLRRGQTALVVGLVDHAALAGDSASNTALLYRLRDLGFVAGARCEVIARMWPAGDPMAVRIGGSMFALRRAEAAAIRVIRTQEQASPDASFATA